MSETCLGGLRIPPANEDAIARAQARWDDIAKPIGSLGALEDAVVQIAGLTGDAHVDVSRRCAVVLCADNGVVAEGVSSSGADVTPIIARGVVRGTSSVGRMCAAAHIDCMAVDMGMFEPLDEPGLIDRRIAAGTGNIACGPAMTREQAMAAVRVGIDLVGTLAHKGYGLVATGEMGIGNTTTATAVACALLGLDPHGACGRGAGLNDAGLARKVAVVRRALATNMPNPEDPLDVLAKVGGFDIAGMCGMFLGGAVHRVPIVVDGLIARSRRSWPGACAPSAPSPCSARTSRPSPPPRRSCVSLVWSRFCTPACAWERERGPSAWSRCSTWRWRSTTRDCRLAT